MSFLNTIRYYAARVYDVLSNNTNGDRAHILCNDSAVRQEGQSFQDCYLNGRTHFLIPPPRQIPERPFWMGGEQILMWRRQ